MKYAFILFVMLSIYFVFCFLFCDQAKILDQIRYTKKRDFDSYLDLKFS